MKKRLPPVITLWKRTPPVWLLLAVSALPLSLLADETTASGKDSPAGAGAVSEPESLADSVDWFDYFFDDPRAELSAQDVEPSSQETWYDEAHDAISETIDNSATWFDNFFGDPRQRLEDKGKRADASLKITIEGFYSGVDGESDADIRAKGSIALPRTENRLRLAFTSDADSAITGQDAVNTEPQKEPGLSRDRGGLGLAYLVYENPANLVTLGAGIKGGPELYAKGIYRYTLPLAETTRLRVTNTLYWITDDGTGVSSLLDFEHATREDTLWRYTLFGNYSETTVGLEWSTQATWLRQLDKKTAISARLGVKGETDKPDAVTETWTTFRYRANFLRPWLFYEIEPGLSWHEKEDYDTEPTLAVRLEVLF